MTERFARSIGDRLFLSITHNPDIAAILRRNGKPRMRLERLDRQVFFTARIGDSFVNVDLI